MTPLEGNMSGAQKPVYVSTYQERIAKVAKEASEAELPISVPFSRVGCETASRRPVASS